MSRQYKASIDAATLATVTVTWNPGLDLLSAQLRELPTVTHKIIVDNASSTVVAEKIEALVSQLPNAVLLRNSENLGLAAAINQGVKHASALTPQAKFVLLLDQDSTPMPGSIETLIGAFETLAASGNNIGCAGPLLRDPDTGLTHGFHQCTRWRWKRVYPTPGSVQPVACANLNGSGTLVPMALFTKLGGLDESLFIDHVDTEWAFRVLANRYSLWGIPSAVFEHHMGQASTRFWFFGWRVWPSRSPQRHYYLFRNAVALMRRQYVPQVWKWWAVAKLMLTAGRTFICGPQRGQQLFNMAHGIVSGVHIRQASNDLS